MPHHSQVTLFIAFLGAAVKYVCALTMYSVLCQHSALTVASRTGILQGTRAELDDQQRSGGRRGFFAGLRGAMAPVMRSLVCVPPPTKQPYTPGRYRSEGTKHVEVCSMCKC